MTNFITVFVLVATSLLYFTGWMYLYYYLFEFGFSVFEVEVPFHYILIYSFAVLDGIFARPGEDLASVAVFLTVLACARLFYRSQQTQPFPERARALDDPWFRGFWIVASFILVIAVFLLAQNEARMAASNQAASIRSDPSPRIIQMSNEFIESVRMYRADLRGHSLEHFFVQDSGVRDWPNYAVHVVFADQERYFVVLRLAAGGAETSLRIDADDVVFLGVHYDPISGD